jgi:hypothetical protein
VGGDVQRRVPAAAPSRDPRVGQFRLLVEQLRQLIQRAGMDSGRELYSERIVRGELHHIRG